MQHIPEIKAEFLLSTLYPEHEGLWNVFCDGTFYRNYTADIISLYPEINEVHISRDGILKLLPSAMLGDESELLSGEKTAKWEAMNQRIELLKTAYRPFDSHFFNESLKLEQETARILGKREEFILQQLFGLDINSITNPVVKVFACLLPYVEILRGNIPFIATLLAELTSSHVDIQYGRYSHDDDTLGCVPSLKLQIRIDNLEQERFCELYAQLAELETFLISHFIPFDTHFEICLVGKATEQLLDYDTILI